MGRRELLERDWIEGPQPGSNVAGKITHQALEEGYVLYRMGHYYRLHDGFVQQRSVREGWRNYSTFKDWEADTAIQHLHYEVCYASLVP